MPSGLTLDSGGMKEAIAHLLANRHSKTGIVPLAALPQLIADDQKAHQIALKEGLLSTYGDAVFHTPSEDVALYQAVADQFSAADFQSLCLTVQEDLLVLKQVGDRFILSGGGLFFPSKWALQEKVGKPLTSIHMPVPHFDDALARTVERLLVRLPDDRPLLRYNWTLHDDDVLFQHPKFHHADRVTPDQMILRSERQTLSKIAGTNAVLFTIKTLQQPLKDAIASQPKFAEFLRQEIQAMDATALAYKSLDGRAKLINDYLA